MASRCGQGWAAGSQRRRQESSDLQDTYLLHGEPSPPLSNLSLHASWWSGRDDHRETGPSLGRDDHRETGPSLGRDEHREIGPSLGRDEHRETGPSLGEQLVERNQHVARLQDALRREREKGSSLQCRCNQQGSELRRREQHSARLKERLTQLAERHRERGASMELLNPVPRGQVKRDRPARTNGRKEEAALRVMLERREAELREAMKLRHKLTTLLHALRADMERTLLDTVGDQEEDPDSAKMLVQSEESLGEHVTGGVFQGWKSVQRRLGDLLSQGHVAVGTDQDKLLAQLETELDQSQQLVKLQQHLLQDSVITPVPAALTDCYFLEEWERLQDSWAELEHQKRSFHRERRAFTDAAIRLGHERREFEQQRACVVKQHYLFDSPLGRTLQRHNRRESTVLNLSDSDHMILSGCRPATPSSAESGIIPWLGSSGSLQVHGKVKVHTPSTPELYSALQLPYSCRSSESDAQSECWDVGAERLQFAPTGPHLDGSFQ
ncbi:afadin- and alpha-actinin-binding protein isoform X2 [Oncorhynchus tshawytscha]|uniref:afadin- and alpha-actinin-binding protein isoform X2 n=1 Tax=Oncorhynchus tshawytscha TaxID=74940 RepID=UPI001C3DA89C|nr:afadin- and alpha-actinin-binding protein isoform X2 [Oncorhynchus tshawytscha]